MSLVAADSPVRAFRLPAMQGAPGVVSSRPSNVVASYRSLLDESDEAAQNSGE